MNYYQVLGIPDNATDKDIKKAYKKLVKKYHPDIFHGDKEFAENKIKEINEAYDTLSVPDLKAEYDELLHGTSDNDYSYGSSSRSSQANDNYNYNSRVRDNDFYNSDSYRHYSSYKYYNRSQPSEEFEAYKRSQAPIKDDGLFAGSKSKFVVLIGVAAIITIILLIILLNVLKELTKPDNLFNDFDVQEENGILLIEKGVAYSTVTNYYGQPDSIKYVPNGYYAYYGRSYILFNKNNCVEDWVNKGELVTTYNKGQQEELYNELYNELQNQMYFE